MIPIRSRPGATPLRTGIIAAGSGFLLAAGMVVAAGASIGTGSVYGAKALGAYVVMVAIALVNLEDHHPFASFGPANHVTTIRAMLVALVAGLIGEPETHAVAWSAVSVAALVTALDGVDGALARRSGMVSGFGARFDMETDALLILVLSVLTWQHAKAGPWVLLCGLMRYAFVAAGWVMPWLARPLRSTTRGKAAAVAQMLGLCVALAPVVPLPISAGVAAAALATLIWSFAIDVMWMRRQYQR